MKKILGILSGLVLTLAFASTVSAAENWDMTGTYTIDYVCTSGCSGTYPHTMNVTSHDTDTGAFLGNGHYDSNNAYTWDLTGDTSGSTVDYLVTYTGLNPGYTVTATGIITADGTISGTALSSSSQAFTWSTTSGVAKFNRYAEITAPDEDEIVHGDVSFEAYLMDNDYDYVDWAVREGTCAAGTNTVFGNVDGYSNTYSWTLADTYKYEFTAVADTSGWNGGMYCFIFNPREDSGETGIRLTREFYIAEGKVSGGGQIIEEFGPKPKDNHKISFGGAIYDVGLAGYMGDWEVNFHNVGDNAYDKSKFHGTNITDINFFDGNNTSCYDAVNFTVLGEWNGNPGYKIIFRAGDFGSPGKADTVRVTLYNGNTPVYDTHTPTEFGDESSCVGTARTGLDHGNITIWN